MAMAELPEELFVAAVKEIVAADADWNLIRRTDGKVAKISVVGVGMTLSQKFIVIDAHDHQTSEVWLIDATTDGPPRCVAPRLANREYEVDERGGTLGAGPFHSQSMEGIYAQYPGLVVLTPATVSDAYHMLLDGVAAYLRAPGLG